jgi:hypothetical protein
MDVQDANCFSDRFAGVMKASYLFKQNIKALLAARGQRPHDLAFFCRRSDAWLSKILGKDDRNLPLEYLDKFADFFGVAPYQLFQPGISPLTERRKGADRRTARDRRISQVLASRVLAGRGIEEPILAALEREEFEVVRGYRNGSTRKREELRRAAAAEEPQSTAPRTAARENRPETPRAAGRKAPAARRKIRNASTAEKAPP